MTEILYRALARELNGAREAPGAHDALEGAHHVDKIIEIDQSPIGRTPRSNPATYTGLFGTIRELFAGVPEARVRGYMPGRFSFNVKGGRCENCKGDGILKIEMQFLPDVYVPCEVCKGKRYNREALEIHYRGHSIADVLDMTIEEALDVFGAVPKVATKLRTLVDVGLGYVHLGQPATTLSGGEAQRVKLATELSRRATGKTLYVLDEPTTGLHFADVEKLLQVLHRLVDAGNTVVVIEHNLDVIKTADWIVDLGPEGGTRGGEIVAEGTPEEVARVLGSATGEYLARVLRGEPLVPLSDVTFAEELGRELARTAASTGEAVPPTPRAASARRRFPAGGPEAPGRPTVGAGAGSVGVRPGRHRRRAGLDAPTDYPSAARGRGRTPDGQAQGAAMFRRYRWLTILVPALVVGVIELLSDSLLDVAFPFPLDTILIVGVVLALSAVFSFVAYRRTDALTARLEAQNEALEARNATARALHRVSVAIAALADVDPVLAGGGRPTPASCWRPTWRSCSWSHPDGRAGRPGIERPARTRSARGGDGDDDALRFDRSRPRGRAASPRRSSAAARRSGSLVVGCGDRAELRRR